MQPTLGLAPARTLSREDRISLGLLAFFIVAGFTIELYFVVFHAHLPERDDLFARAYAIYSAADLAYYRGTGDSFPVALENLNVFVTQPLYVWLAFAIWKGRAYRHPLQLLVSGYLAYSVVLYFAVAHASGYEAMPIKTAGAYALFYGANLPWLVGQAWLAWRSFRALTRAAESASRRSAG